MDDIKILVYLYYNLWDESFLLGRTWMNTVCVSICAVKRVDDTEIVGNLKIPAAVDMRRSCKEWSLWGKTTTREILSPVYSSDPASPTTIRNSCARLVLFNKVTSSWNGEPTYALSSYLHLTWHIADRKHTRGSYIDEDTIWFRLLISFCLSSDSLKEPLTLLHETTKLPNRASEDDTDFNFGNFNLIGLE